MLPDIELKNEPNYYDNEETMNDSTLTNQKEIPFQEQRKKTLNEIVADYHDLEEMLIDSDWFILFGLQDK